VEIRRVEISSVGGPNGADLREILAERGPLALDALGQEGVSVRELRDRFGEAPFSSREDSHRP
jgi:hypothetical protein